MRLLLIVLLSSLVGCASSPEYEYYPYPLASAVPIPELETPPDSEEGRELTRRFEAKLPPSGTQKPLHGELVESPYPPPVVVPKFAGSTAGGSLVVLKARAFLLAPDYPPETPVGFVIFTGKPATPQQEELYKQVCKSWMATFPLKSNLEDLYAKSNVKTFTTYWPVTKDVKSCEDFETYSYATADFLLANIGVRKSGVFLLLVSDTVKARKTLTLELSMLTPSDVARAFDTWKTELVIDAKGDWSSLFKLYVFREKFRYYLNTYGNTVLSSK